jgi:hypothetical protein
MNSLSPSGVAAGALPRRAALSILRSHLDGAAFASEAPAPLCVANADVSLDDWNVMFDAVRARLTLVAHERTGGPSSALHAAPVGVAILECVAALDLLHAMLERERARRRDA